MELVFGGEGRAADFEGSEVSWIVSFSIFMRFKSSLVKYTA
jgi:hypothetical protein